MDEDYFLESDYEDRYTIKGDIDEEDKSYLEDESDEEDICDSCNFKYENCQCIYSDEDDFHYDSPSLQDIYPEMPSYGN